MNIRKTIIKIITVTAIILLIVRLTISFAKIDPNNTYTIEADKTNVKANDIVTVTLRVKIPEGSKGIQGRVEYDTNLTFLEDEVSNSDFGDYGVFGLGHDSDIHAIGFATILQDGFVSGDVMVVKLKFKVTGLAGGEYKVYWKDYDENGYFEIGSVTLKRTDVVSGNTSEDSSVGSSGTNSGNNSGTDSEDDVSIGDIIDAEAEGKNIIYNDMVQDDMEQSNNPYINTDNAGRNSITLPHTGEKLPLLVAIISAILLGICIYIRNKKLKF